MNQSVYVMEASLAAAVVAIVQDELDYEENYEYEQNNTVLLRHQGLMLPNRP